MVLGDQKLKSLTNNPDLVGPASLDLTLQGHILVPKQQGLIRLGGKVRYFHVPFTDEHPFILMPGCFVLAATDQYVKVPDNLCAFVQGRSSIGRIGLTVQNAGFVDPGFEGTITLELVNENRNPIALVPHYRVAQLVYMDVSNVERPYDGKYNAQRWPTGSRMYKDKEVQR